MRRYLIIIFLFLASVSFAQVMNFAKTLPVRAYSLGAATAYNTDTPYSDGGLSYYLYGGYGFSYSLDVNFKYGLYPGTDYFGADMQYLFREKRKSYYTVIGGIHWQDDFWIDMTWSFTYAAQFWINFTFGLDFELGLMENLLFRAWIPLNAGIQLGEYVYLYLEYNLPANGKTWDILAIGANYIIR